MITNRPPFTTRIFGALAVLLLATVAANAQWITPDGSGNISHTNSGNVGIGTNTPGSLPATWFSLPELTSQRLENG
jgi:hypothetical protein